MNQVYCQHPVKIINPKCVEFVLSNFNDLFVADYVDSSIHLSRCSIHIRKDCTTQSFKQEIMKYLQLIRNTHKYVDSLCNSVGEYIEFYINVPCGHCLLCNHKKRVALASKCSMENQSHDNLPLFVTLTYDNKHLPPFGLRYSDVQKFLKRLRITLERKHSFTGRLRYVCAGEYGSKTNRPHYHLLIWDFPCKSIGDLFAIDKFIRDIWKQGITQTKPCDNSDAGLYLGKYLSKSVFTKVPTSLVQPFHVCSINLGVKFVESVCRDVILRNPKQTYFEYNDKFSGALKRLPLISYFIKKMFPSKNEAIPVTFRNALMDFAVISRDFPFLSICDSYTFALFSPILKSVPPEEFRHCIFHQDWLESATYEIAKSMDSDYFRLSDDHFFVNDSIRSQFYVKMFENLNIDIDTKAKTIARDLAVEIEKETF